MTFQPPRDYRFPTELSEDFQNFVGQGSKYDQITRGECINIVIWLLRELGYTATAVGGLVDLTRQQVSTNYNKAVDVIDRAHTAIRNAHQGLAPGGVVDVSLICKDYSPFALVSRANPGPPPAAVAFRLQVAPHVARSPTFRVLKGLIQWRHTDSLLYRYIRETRLTLKRPVKSCRAFNSPATEACRYQRAIEFFDLFRDFLDGVTFIVYQDETGCWHNTSCKHNHLTITNTDAYCGCNTGQRWKANVDIFMTHHGIIAFVQRYTNHTAQDMTDDIAEMWNRCRLPGNAAILQNYQEMCLVWDNHSTHLRSLHTRAFIGDAIDQYHDNVNNGIDPWDATLPENRNAPPMGFRCQNFAVYSPTENINWMLKCEVSVRVHAVYEANANVVGYVMPEAEFRQIVWDAVASLNARPDIVQRCRNIIKDCVEIQLSLVESNGNLQQAALNRAARRENPATPIPADIAQQFPTLDFQWPA